MEIRSDGEGYGAGWRSAPGWRRASGWPLRWSSSERQRASVETTPLTAPENFRNTSPQLPEMPHSRSGSVGGRCQNSLYDNGIRRHRTATRSRPRSPPSPDNSHEVADLGLWTLRPAETETNLTALAQLRHQITELELRHAHHADRLDLGAQAGATDTAAWWANQHPPDQTGRQAAPRSGQRAGLRPRAGPGRDGRRPGLRGPGGGDRQGRRRAPGRAPPRGGEPPDRPCRRARPGRAAPDRAPRPRSGRPRDRRRTPAQGPATPRSTRRGSLPVHHRRRRPRTVPRPVHPARPRSGRCSSRRCSRSTHPNTAATPAPRRGSGTRSASTSPATRPTGSPRPAASTPRSWSP